VTKGAMYHYFTSKEELLFAIYGTGFSEQLATLDVILNSYKDPATALREIIYDTVGNTAAHAKTAAVFAREAARLDQRHLQTLQAQWRQYQDAVRGLIRAAQASGEFASNASPETISWAIFGFTNSMPTWYRPDGPKTADEIAGELADLVLAGLRPSVAQPSVKKEQTHA